MNTTIAGYPRLAARVIGPLMLVGLLLASTIAQSAARLQSIDYSQLPGDRLEFVLRLDGPATTPRDFQTENPDRTVLDFPGVGNALEKKSLAIQRAGVRNVQAIEAGGRTRVVFNLEGRQAYSLRADGNRVLLTFQSQAGARTAAPPTLPANYISPAAAGGSRYAPSAPAGYPAYAVTQELGNVDFRRGETGEGRLLVTLGNPKALVDIRREGRKVIVRLPVAGCRVAAPPVPPSGCHRLCHAGALHRGDRGARRRQNRRDAGQ